MEGTPMIGLNVGEIIGTVGQGQKSGPLPIFLNLDYLFCAIFDCKE